MRSVAIMAEISSVFALAFHDRVDIVYELGDARPMYYTIPGFIIGLSYRMKYNVHMYTQ